jgi:hypothetical protein
MMLHLQLQVTMEVAGKSKAPGIPLSCSKHFDRNSKIMKTRKTENFNAKLKSRANLLFNEKLL